MSFNHDNNKKIAKIYKVFICVIAVILILQHIIFNSSIFYRKDINLPFSLHLNKQDLVLVKGEEYHLYVFGINKRVYFSTTNFRVAGVNFNGRVFARQPGLAFIIAKVDGKELKCRVRVIELNKDKLTLKAGSSYRLKVKGVTVLPQWKSSNKKVASVNIFGKVKAKRKGTAIITAKVNGKVVTCKVKVR